MLYLLHSHPNLFFTYLGLGGGGTLVSFMFDKLPEIGGHFGGQYHNINNTWKNNLWILGFYEF